MWLLPECDLSTLQGDFKALPNFHLLDDDEDYLNLAAPPSDSPEEGRYQRVPHLLNKLRTIPSEEPMSKSDMFKHKLLYVDPNKQVVGD